MEGGGGGGDLFLHTTRGANVGVVMCNNSRLVTSKNSNPLRLSLINPLRKTKQTTCKKYNLATQNGNPL